MMAAGDGPAPALTLYEKLVNEEDARICADISDAACREVPGNFLLILATSVLTKLGDALASPKTVLAWITTAVGAPAAVLGMLVPIRESGSLIPQLLIGGYVRGVAVRKWAWVIGSLVQGVAVLAMAWTALHLTGAAAGWALAGLLLLFSLARGLCSVAAKDVLGKTIPKGQRGQLTGWSSSAAGLVSIGVGFLLMTIPVANLGTGVLVALLVGAGGLWLVAAALFTGVTEQPGETDGGASGIRQAVDALGLLWNDRPFARFVTARALLMCSALSAPFYVALAQQQASAGIGTLGAFVVAAGAASLLSAPVWGRFADRSSRDVMFWAGCLAAAVGAAVFALERMLPESLAGGWPVPLAYFLLSIAHSGVRVGRKTYVVDLAAGNRRTDYVAVSNSVIGTLLLMVGLMGLLADRLGADGMIGLLALMGAAGALATRRLERV
ncbi:MAG: MFS transporter [Pseudomonadales bacterium]